MVQDLATQWVQSLFVQNENFSGNEKKLIKISGTVESTESYLYGQLDRMWKARQKPHMVALTESGKHRQHDEIWEST